MRALFSPTFRLLRNDQPFINATVIFLITTLFYFVGAMLRLVEALSLFWPLNAVMAGIFARYAFLQRWPYYLMSFVAMLIYDGVTTSWGWSSVVINFSNMVFIITMAQLVQREQRLMRHAPQPINALNLFGYCLVSAMLCSLFGAFGSMGVVINQDFLMLFGDWFSEQFSTGVLILPCILTAVWPDTRLALNSKTLLPVLALIVSVLASVWVGGAGSLAFPLPALIWCAVTFSLPLTCLLTLITGGLEIILVANGLINIFVASPLQMSRMFSARLGIATMAICPVIVSVSVETINRLMRHVSLRADYDFLTRVYSRSGLYEALNHDSNGFANQHLTVMLLDIDYFKSVNDNHGHECGDRILTSFAQKVRQALGEQGIIARMGGEEFAVIAATPSPQQGFLLAERLRKSVEGQLFHWHDQTLRLTVSIGVSNGQVLSGSLTEAFNKLLAEADEYLYRSKKAGRNCTSMRQSPLEETLKPSVSF
ncbi:diguanylate cyclase [Phytobacter diazotrophicus]|uniref:GGDEF domain-containing protein n=1 Tax=Phytobacter diazotrophicus TaxID=395631 RepID=UPI00290B7D7C|nr:diguanylate cyclase [Phytobacter diazotrophicus]MDU7201079.1 diguanylate cyclase [Enterobacteriaceae bacterium]MDV2875131.1 diguanylate cyclase [Phytobacter diazotrophicus]